jgi:hypothetical protein
MKTEQRELHGFEQRLLGELRRMIIADQAASQPATGSDDPRRRLGWTRRLTLASSIVVVAAIAMAVGLPFVDGEGSLPAGGPSAAYAVTGNANGTVTVEINAIRDAKGLQRELRRVGVPAIVQYVPSGDACSEDTFALIRPAGSKVGAIEPSEEGSLRFEIDKNALEPGQKLFIYTVAHASGNSSEPASAIAVSIVDGKFAGC